MCGTEKKLIIITDYWIGSTIPCHLVQPNLQCISSIRGCSNYIMHGTTHGQQKINSCDFRYLTLG